jgi:hypothetical protein
MKLKNLFFIKFSKIFLKFIIINYFFFFFFLLRVNLISKYMYKILKSLLVYSVRGFIIRVIIF